MPRPRSPAIPGPAVFCALIAAAVACAAEPLPPAVTRSTVATQPSAPSAGGAVTRDIGELHRARCGACHVRVEPGTRTRDALTAALARHRTRVRLTAAEWDALVDYLALRGRATE